jgi:hypothetical protein
MAATLSADQEQVSAVFPFFLVLLLKAILTLPLVGVRTRRRPLSARFRPFDSKVDALLGIYVGASEPPIHRSTALGACRQGVYLQIHTCHSKQPKRCTSLNHHACGGYSWKFYFVLKLTSVVCASKIRMGARDEKF